MKREETASAPSAPDDVWDAIACPGLKFFVFGFFPFSFLIAVLLRDACRVLFHFQLGILLFAVAFVLWDRAEFGGVHQWKKAALVVLSLVLVVYCVHGFFLIRTVSSLAKLDREYGLGSPSPLASLDAAMTLVAREDAADAGRTRSGEETRFALPQEDVDYLVDVRTSAARQPRIALWWYGDLQACNCTKQYLATVAKSQADPESVSMPAAHRDAAPSVPMPSAEAAAADVLHRRRMLRFLAWASISMVIVATAIALSFVIVLCPQLDWAQLRGCPRGVALLLLSALCGRCAAALRFLSHSGGANGGGGAGAPMMLLRPSGKASLIPRPQQQQQQQQQQPQQQQQQQSRWSGSVGRPQTRLDAVREDDRGAEGDASDVDP